MKICRTENCYLYFIYFPFDYQFGKWKISLTKWLGSTCEKVSLFANWYKVLLMTVVEKLH